MASTDEASADDKLRFIKWHANNFQANSKYFKSAYFENTKETRLENTVCKPAHNKFIVGATTNYYHNAHINTQGNINRSTPLMFESDILDFIKKKEDETTLEIIIEDAVYGKKGKELLHKFIDFKIYKAKPEDQIRIYVCTSLTSYLKRSDFLITHEKNGSTKEVKKEVKIEGIHNLYLRFLPCNLSDLERAFKNFDTLQQNKTNLHESFQKWQQHDFGMTSKDYICQRIICAKKDSGDVVKTFGTVRLKTDNIKNSVKLVNVKSHDTTSDFQYIDGLNDYRFYFSAHFEETDEFHIIPSVMDQSKCIKLIKSAEVKTFIQGFLHEEITQYLSKQRDKYPTEYIFKIDTIIKKDIDNLTKLLQLTYSFKDDTTLHKVWTKHYSANIREYDLVFNPLSMWNLCCDMPFKKKTKEVELFIENLPLKQIKIHEDLDLLKFEKSQLYTKLIHIYVHSIKDEKNSINTLNELGTFESIPDDSELMKTILNKLRGIKQTSQMKYDSEAKKFCRLILSESERQFANRFKQRYGQKCSFGIRHALMQYFAKKSLKKIESRDSFVKYALEVCEPVPDEFSSIEIQMDFGFLYSKKNKNLFVYTSDYGVKLGIPLMYQSNLEIVPKLITNNEDPLKSNSLFGSKYCVYIDSENCKTEGRKIKPMFHRYKMYAIVLSLIHYVKNRSIYNNPFILAVKTKECDNLWRSQLSFVLKLFPLGSASIDTSWDDARNLALFQKNVYEVISFDDKGAHTPSIVEKELLIRPFPTLEELTSMMRFLLEKGDQLFIEEHKQQLVIPVKDVSSSIEFMCMEMGECEDDCNANIDFMMHDMEDEPAELEDELAELETPRTRSKEARKTSCAAAVEKHKNTGYSDSSDDALDSENDGVPPRTSQRILAKRSGR